MRKMILIAFVAMMTMGASAQGPAKVPAYRGLIERIQPNGDTLRTYLRGDERMHWMMTEDGWQIRQNPKGWFVYAKLKKENAVISKHKAHNPGKRSKCEKKWLKKYGIKKSL